MDILSSDRPDRHVLEQEREAKTSQPRGLVPAASFNRLKDYEECPYRVYLSAVCKYKGEDSPAAARGNEIHDLSEAYIRGEGEDLPPPLALAKLAHQYYTLRQRFLEKPETFQLEEQWGFDDQWMTTNWMGDDIWFRQKLDVFEMEDDTSANIIDHKTGKKWGNELKHGDQGLQYAIGAFMKYPSLQFVTTNFYYIDQGETLPKSFTRQQAMTLKPRLEQRIFALTNANEEQLKQPRPSRHNCRFCDHAKSGNCEFAITT